MGYHNDRLPVGIEQGSSGGPGWDNRIVELPDSGADEIVQVSSSPRWKFNIGFAVAQHGNVATVNAHYINRGGAANSFPFKHWTDFNSTASGTYTGTVNHQDQLIGTGDGSTKNFQLIKRYTSGSQTFVRTIRKPVSGTVVVALDTTQQTSGFTVDHSTGIVSFTTAPTLGVLVKAGFEFDVPVRYGEDADKWFEVRHDAYDASSVPSLTLVEQRDPGGDPEDLPMGGGRNHGVVTADFQISFDNGVAQSFTTNAAGLNGFLPDATNLADGRIRFHLRNSGSSSFTVKSSTGVTVGTVGVSATALVALFKDAGGAKAWVLK